MDSEKYQIGEHVIIQKDDSLVVGKIEEIFSEAGKNMIKYNDYYSPDRTTAGKQDHNSRNEFFKTDEIEKAEVSKIVSRCEVLKFDLYIKKLLLNKEKKHSSNHTPQENQTFFVRQKYLVDMEHFQPDLPTTCYCDQVFNPDKNFIQCKKCKELIHLECYLLGENKKCFNPSCNNSIEEQLNTVQKSANESLIGNKRRREDEEKIEKNATSVNVNAKGANINLSQNSSSHNASMLVDLTKEQVYEKEKESQPGTQIEEKASNLDIYPNLSEDRKKYLMILTDKIEKKNNALNKNNNLEEKSRRTVRDMICNSLLYGIEEIKQNGDWKKMRNPELIQENASESHIVSICSNIAVSIETAAYLLNNESMNTNYKKKLRTITSNLADHRNHELRFSILNKDISPEELIKMGAEELAPSSLKNRRIERQNKYFKEQVLMKEETKITAKTNKGDMLTVEDEIFNREELIPSMKLNNTRESLDFSSNNNLYCSDNDMSVLSEENKENRDSNLNLNLDRVNSDSANCLKMNNEILKENADLPAEKESKTIDKLRNDATPSTLNEPNLRKNVGTGKKREIKYKNLTQDQINFYILLEEYKKENLLSKFDNKLKSHLKISTYNEIVKYRQEN